MSSPDAAQEKGCSAETRQIKSEGSQRQTEEIDK
jgi:hypothetical protein